MLNALYDVQESIRVDIYTLKASFAIFIWRGGMRGPAGPRGGPRGPAGGFELYPLLTQKLKISPKFCLSIICMVGVLVHYMNFQDSNLTPLDFAKVRQMVSLILFGSLFNAYCACSNKTNTNYGSN